MGHFVEHMPYIPNFSFKVQHYSTLEKSLRGVKSCARHYTSFDYNYLHLCVKHRQICKHSYHNCSTVDMNTHHIHTLPLALPGPASGTLWVCKLLQYHLEETRWDLSEVPTQWWADEWSNTPQSPLAPQPQSTAPRDRQEEGKIKKADIKTDSMSIW